MTALLDTNAYTAMMRGDNAIIRALSETDRILMSVIVIGELEYGFRHGQRYGDNRAHLDEWLAETYVDFATVTRNTTIKYGQVSSMLRSNGQKIPTNDTWIAAHALEYGATLWTRDKHFDYIEMLDVRRW